MGALLSQQRDGFFLVLQKCISNISCARKLPLSSASSGKESPSLLPRITLVVLTHCLHLSPLSHLRICLRLYRPGLHRVVLLVEWSHEGIIFTLFLQMHMTSSPFLLTPLTWHYFSVSLPAVPSSLPPLYPFLSLPSLFLHVSLLPSHPQGHRNKMRQCVKMILNNGPWLVWNCFTPCAACPLCVIDQQHTTCWKKEAPAKLVFNLAETETNKQKSAMFMWIIQRYVGVRLKKKKSIC